MRRLVATLFRGAQGNDAHLRVLTPERADMLRDMIREQSLERYPDTDVHTRFLDLRQRRLRFSLDDVAQKCAETAESGWPERVSEFLDRTAAVTPLAGFPQQPPAGQRGRLMCKLTTDADHKDTYLHPWFSGLSVGLARADSKPGEWLHDADLTDDIDSLEAEFDEGCLALADYFATGGVRHVLVYQDDVEIHVFSDSEGWAGSGCLVAPVVADLIAEYTEAAGTLIFTAPTNKVLLASWIPVGAHTEPAIQGLKRHGSTFADEDSVLTHDVYEWSVRGYNVVHSAQVDQHGRTPVHSETKPCGNCASSKQHADATS